MKYISVKDLITAFLLQASIIYADVMMHVLSVKSAYTIYSLAITVFSCSAAGLFIFFISSISRFKALNTFIAFASAELIIFHICVEYFLKKTYTQYIEIKTILGGLGGIFSEAGSEILGIITGYWHIILIFHIPIIVLVILRILDVITFQEIKVRGLLKCIILAALIEICAVAMLFVPKKSREAVTEKFRFDNIVKNYSSLTAIKSDTIYTIFGNPWKGSLNVYAQDAANTSDYSEDEYNVLNIDFDEMFSLTSDKTVKETIEYISQLVPSKKNKYTGIFEGKNLIQITAESFVPYIVDEELTPALYRLKENSIVFEKYYQPLWSGSTTTGEFQIISGLVPYDGYYCMKDTIGNDMRFTIANQLKEKGYNTVAFHNGTYNYYNRHITHKNFGYDEYYANNYGMTGLSGGKDGWPQSDLEMMQFIAPEFISKDNEPFCEYIMTVSGHSSYVTTNWVVEKNYDEVCKWAKKNGYNYSKAVLCYYACNLELEKALEYLFEQLEEAGTLDDTVIVLTGDHYPYALSDKEQYDEDGNKTRYAIGDKIEELFGYKPEDQAEQNFNALYIWSNELEDSSEKITVEEPVSSVDILPTLSNLFGVDFDSRMLTGRDALADDTCPLVIFADYSWLTDIGYYDMQEDTFKLSDGSMAADGEYDEYIEKINLLVENEVNLSSNIILYDIYRLLD